MKKAMLVAMLFSVMLLMSASTAFACQSCTIESGHEVCVTHMSGFWKCSTVSQNQTVNSGSGCLYGVCFGTDPPDPDFKKQGWLQVKGLADSLSIVSPFIGAWIKDLQAGILAAEPDSAVADIHFGGHYLAPRTSPHEAFEYIGYEADWDLQKGIAFTITEWEGRARSFQFDMLVITNDGNWVLNPKGNEDPKKLFSSTGNAEAIMHSIPSTPFVPNK